MQEHDTILKAADHLSAHGLAKNSFRTPDHSVCGLGAVRMVLFGTTQIPLEDYSGCQGSNYDSYVLICNRMESWAQRNNHTGWVGFNDDEATSKEDVILALKEIAYEMGDK